jgi:DNA invertase Pin-like site-specific DNA recombinase
MPIRAALYARVSSDAQAKKQTSIPVQLRECREWAKSLGWAIVAEYKDEGFSGTTIARPQFQQLVADAEKGRFDRILIHAVDRFGRSKADAAIKEQLRETHGIKFAYFLERIEDDGDSDLVIGVQELMAQQFSKTLGKRASKGQREAVRQGRIGFGGRAPYGYQVKRVDRHRTFEPHPAAAPIVAEIFKRYAAGEPIRTIATWLNDSNIPSPSQLNGTQNSATPTGYWNTTAVHDILKRPCYVGDLTIGRLKTIRSKNGKRTARRADESTWEVKPDALPALVDRETFRQAQAHFKTNLQHKRSSDHPGNPLAGIGRCKNCGGPISIERNHSEASQKKACYYFLCVRFRRYKLSAKETCGSGVRYDEVMERVRSAVALYLSATRRDLVTKAIAAFNERACAVAESPELKSARAALARIEKQEANYLHAIATADDPEGIPALTIRLRDAGKAKEALRAQVVELESQERIQFEPIDTTRFLRSAKEMRRRMNAGEPLSKELLSSCFWRIYLDFTKSDKFDALVEMKKRLAALVSDAEKPLQKRKKAAELLAAMDAERVGDRVISIPRFEAQIEFLGLTPSSVPDAALQLLKAP